MKKDCELHKNGNWYIFTYTEVFLFFGIITVLWLHRGWIPVVHLPSFDGPKGATWAAWAGASAAPSSFLLGIFWSFFFLHFRKPSWLVECLICSIPTFNSLGKSLALNLFVYKNAKSMLCNIVIPPSFALVTLGDILFWTVPIPYMPIMSHFLWFPCMWPMKQFHVF